MVGNGKMKVLVTTVLVLVAVLAIGFLAPYQHQNEWTCAGTGSQKGTTTWLGGRVNDTWERQAPFELWLAKTGRPVEHNWVRTSDSRVCPFVARENTSFKQPPIAAMPSCIQTRFLHQATVAEVNAFLKALAAGDDKAAQKAVETLIARMDKIPAGAPAIPAAAVAVTAP